MYRGRFIPGDPCGDSSGESSPATRLESPSPHDRSRLALSNKSADAGEVRKKHAARIACILVSNFPLAAIVRSNPELRDRPIGLIRMPTAKRPVAGKGHAVAYQPHSELTHISAAAKAAGIQTGMTVAQARSLLPSLTVMAPSPAAERAAMDALIDAAESLSPVFEAGQPGCVWIDLGGLENLHRHAKAGAAARGANAPDAASAFEHEIAEEAAGRVNRIGLDAAVGIAASKEVAHLAARCGGLRVIPPGHEREFLDWMPLELTELGSDRIGEELELRLKRLGLRRLGDLARLDIRAVGSRFGATAVTLMRLAQGEGDATLQMRPRSEVFAESVELEYGIENLEALGFILHAMLKRLGERLQLRGLVAGDMTLSLGLADRSHDDRRIAVAAATAEVRSLLMLLNLSLASKPPPAAIETIRLTLEPRPPRPAQNDMFLPPSPAPDRLEAAIARIAAMCGPDRVGTLLPAESYRPEAVRLAEFAPPPPPKIPPPPMGERSGQKREGLPNKTNIARMAVRTIRPAEKIEVMCTRETPEFVRGANIASRVISIAGPWRYQGEWWATADEAQERSAAASSGWQGNAPATYARDYYELALADGGVYRVYRDHYTLQWFLDGVYD